ncbi:MAG: LysR substrate-binding domain-containing protein, partial [Syntrophomonadaceae bacterium]|nr:LysR substrate-binding domain-containing protein [Syntrophomonadaceae bacterium]
LGLSVVSSLSVTEKVQTGQLCALPLRDLPMTRTFFFVYPAKRTLSPLAGRFRDMVLETVP